MHVNVYYQGRLLITYQAIFLCHSIASAMFVSNVRALKSIQKVGHS